VATTRRLYDSQARPIDLGSQLASGGEGVIYLLPGNPGSVAKVYHKPSAAKAAKLSAMARDASAELLKVAAWPTDTLHEAANGPVAGFIMPQVTGYDEIHKLYGPAHRRKSFPTADWAFLVHTAMNCAIAFDTVHARNYVVGDVNQSNILVSRQALVRLIDCDSFQVQSNGRLFLCEVGVAQYTPPELQDGNFSQAARTPNHDRFGLAVLIFHLLFMGRHPFAGRFLGSGDMLLERAIKEFRFAYAPWAGQVQMSPPPFALPMSVLTADLANLFDRAFRPGSEASNARPAAAEWQTALADFQKELVACSAEAGHKLPRQLGKCPWCEIMGSGGPNFFVGVAIVEVIFSPDQAMLARLWSRIEAIPDLAFQYTRPHVPPGQEIKPTVHAAAFPSNRKLQWIVGSLALAVLSLLLAGPSAGKLVCLDLPIVLFLGVWWLALVVNSPLGRVKRHKLHEWRARYHAVNRAEAQWHDILCRFQGEFQQLKASLAVGRDGFLNLKADYEADREKLEQNKQAMQRELFLQSRFISDAVANKEISGIGPGRQVLLESNGIETAYDIRKNKVRAIRGFGPVLVGNLLAWKKRVASEFRFDPSQGIPEADLTALAQKYRQQQDLLRVRLERGAFDLQALSHRATEGLRSHWQTIERLVVDLAQAEADLGALGLRRPAR
jgi:DNA-binding helix-hairpin-helix protein with protein kinase domain